MELRNLGAALIAAHCAAWNGIGWFSLLAAAIATLTPNTQIVRRQP
jgi:hypothetical protein